MPTSNTRVLLFDLQRMVREIIETTIASQPDFQVVFPGGRASLAAAVAAAGADAVITGSDDPELLTSLLTRWPRLKVLAVVASGRETVLYQLLPHREPLGELSPKGLVHALRDPRDSHRPLPPEVTQ